jgi:aspartyl protease family protein
MRALLFASLLIVLVSASAPSLFTLYVQRWGGSEASAAPEVAAEAEPAMPNSSRFVRIKAESDGHFYVEAIVNFRPVRLMVDTGATVVALRQSDAASAGIRVHASDFQYPVQTANGVTKAAEALLDRVIVTDIEVGAVRALILPDDQLTVSLLGGSFLGKLARFEVQNGTLIFEN